MPTVVLRSASMIDAGADGGEAKAEILAKDRSKAATRRCGRSTYACDEIDAKEIDGGKSKVCQITEID